MTTWHVGNLWKSNPSIFVTQLSQGEEKSCRLESGWFYKFNLSSESGQFYKLNLSSDMIFHATSSHHLSQFLPSQVTGNTFPTSEFCASFIEDTPVKTLFILPYQLCLAKSFRKPETTVVST